MAAKASLKRQQELEFEIERRRAEAQIWKLNRTYAVLSDINHAIVRLREPQALFEQACRIAVEKGGFRMAWVGLLDPRTKEIHPVAHAGVTDGYLEKLRILLDDGERGRGPTANALRLGEYVVANDIEHDPRMAPWREDALRLGYRASAAFPLIVAGEARGVLNLYAAEPDFFDEEELHLLEEMVVDIAFAIEFSEQEERRKQAEDVLRESEERYRSLFKNMLEGYAYCQMLFEHNQPQDFIYIAVNPAFETLTGLKDVIGQKVSQVIPGIHESNPELFEIYGRVVLTGQPERFETYLPALGIWFSVSVFSPAKEYFVAVFDNITERKQVEKKVKQQLDELQRWHDLTLERETRSIELKREVNELLRRLQEPIRYPSVEV